MTTVINADGSCYREFTEYADSAFMVGDTADKNNPFVVEIDSTWEISWSYNKAVLNKGFPLKKSTYDSIVANAPDTSFTVHIRRDFKSVEDMAKNFKLKKSHLWSPIKVKYNLNKKFRWFYTYYTYRETYPKIKTNFEIPIENFVTKEEAMFWFTGEPNILQGMNGIEIRDYVGGLENKVNLWFAHNEWNDEYKVLLANYDKMAYQPVSKDSLAFLKDTIFIKNANFMDNEDMNKILNKYFKTKAFSYLWDGKDSPMEIYEKDYEKQDFVQYLKAEFTYKLKMPGIILHTNNAVVKDEVIIWKLNSYRMLYDDYTLEAQSRKTNIWAFILTGIILALAIGSFIYKPRKKN